MIVLANSAGGVGMAAAAAALLGGRSAVDAAEAGIRPVETDPEVRSVGVGGWLNLVGELELDASLMNGRTLEVGAVGALQGYLHPISVARAVMEQLPHVFLVGVGAARFAAEIGAEAGPTITADSQADYDAWLAAHVPPAERQSWPQARLAPYSVLTADPEEKPALPHNTHGTTTFLVIDRVGDLAAGVSTCGWAYKYPGRLGDSPVIGAGGYADNRYGACACTGMGELTIRAGTARSVVLYMKMGRSVEEAVHEAADDLRSLHRRYRGRITIHAVDVNGHHYVLSLGHTADASSYWWWQNGMSAAQECHAVGATW